MSDSIPRGVLHHRLPETERHMEVDTGLLPYHIIPWSRRHSRLHSSITAGRHSAMLTYMRSAPVSPVDDADDVVSALLGLRLLHVAPTAAQVVDVTAQPDTFKDGRKWLKQETLARQVMQ